MIHALRMAVTLFVLWFMLTAVLLLSGCGGPKRTRPETMPFPTKLRPGMKVYPREKVRCLGGGIGGCGPVDGLLGR